MLQPWPIVFTANLLRVKKVTIMDQLDCILEESISRLVTPYLSESTSGNGKAYATYFKKKFFD